MPFAIRNPTLPSCHLDFMHFRRYLVAEDVESIRLADVRHADDAVIEAQLCQVGELVYRLLRRYTAVRAIAGDVDPIKAGLLDLLVGAVLGVAVLSQDVEP